MKPNIILIPITVGFLSLIGCAKEIDQVDVAQGTLNVTNAVNEGANITLTEGSAITYGSNTVGSNSYTRFPLAGGNQIISLGVPGVPATASSAAIPGLTYYTSTLSISNNSNYSLFLTGTSPSAVDNVLIEENYPFAYADSTCGVRFINLATGSNPISVNIMGNANGSEVANLAYKSYSSFVKYPATAVNSTYDFEFRDSGTGALLASYSLSTPYFHNATLCFTGQTGDYGIVMDYDY